MGNVVQDRFLNVFEVEVIGMDPESATEANAVAWEDKTDSATHRIVVGDLAYRANRHRLQQNIANICTAVGTRQPTAAEIAILMEDLDRCIGSST